MAGGGGDQESVTRTEPSEYVKPYIVGDPKKNILGVLPEAQRLYESDMPSYFPGSTVAGLSPETMMALEGTANRALAGSPLNAAAGAETMKTLEGGYLEGNPYLDAIRARGLRDASRIAGSFSAGGRTGSGAMQDSIAEGYGAAVAPYEYGAYESERGRMENAARFAPQLAGQDYLDLNALIGVGDRRQQQGQAELSDEVNRWNFGQNIEQQKLDNLLRAVYGVPGSTSYSSTSGGGQSPLQTGLGAGLGVLSILGSAGVFSAEALKENVEPVDSGSVTERLAELPIKEWSYKGDPERHIGPMAGEFRRRFGVGDGVTLHPADVMGVVLAAAKEQARGFMGPRRSA